MKRLSQSVLLVLLSLTLIAAIPAFAQQTTVMDVHVDKAVAIPGHVLLPGHYIFRLADSESYPGYVQITSADGKRDIGFVQVFSGWRQHYDGTKLVMSRPDKVGLERIVAWYFPGQKFGYRFMYTKRQIRNADLIAQRMQSQSSAGM